MRSLGWAWNPPEGVTEALKRGRIKYQAFLCGQTHSFQRDLDYRTRHPRPTRDQLDLIRAEGEGLS